MPNTPTASAGVSSATRRDPVAKQDSRIPFQCYCGLGPACQFFRVMTPEQRAACSSDKRGTAQWYFKNGLSW